MITYSHVPGRINFVFFYFLVLLYFVLFYFMFSASHFILLLCCCNPLLTLSFYIVDLPTNLSAWGMRRHLMQATSAVQWREEKMDSELGSNAQLRHSLCFYWHMNILLSWKASRQVLGELVIKRLTFPFNAILCTKQDSQATYEACLCFSFVTVNKLRDGWARFDSQ
jgi:hypothetical protein